MKINKENYEEYFLLYADNELTEQERREVEAFVESDLKYQQEFRDILSTVQSPDNIFLDDKSFLLKSRGDVFIDKNNREEKFVEYHDGELNEEEKSFVKQFLDKNQIYQAEFDWIEKAKLSPDSDIHYPAIHDLYRKSARVLYLNFVKYVAAAILTGMIVWYGANKFTGSHSEKVSPLATQVTKPTNPEVGEKNKTSVNQVSDNSLSGKAIANNSSKEKRLPVLQRKNNIAQPEKSSIVNVPSIRKDEPAQQLIANTTQEDDLPFFDNTKEAGKIKTNADLVQGKNIDHLTAKVTIPDKELPGMSENNAGSREFHISPENAEDIFANDFPDDNLRKSKIGILVKKVQRTINRNNPVNRWLNGESGD